MFIALWQEIKSEERKEEILINYITTNPSCKDILSLITEDHYNQDNVSCLEKIFSFTIAKILLGFASLIFAHLTTKN